MTLRQCAGGVSSKKGGANVPLVGGGSDDSVPNQMGVFHTSLSSRSIGCGGDGGGDDEDENKNIGRSGHQAADIEEPIADDEEEDKDAEQNAELVLYTESGRNNKSSSETGSVDFSAMYETEMPKPNNTVSCLYDQALDDGYDEASSRHIAKVACGLEEDKPPSDLEGLQSYTETQLNDMMSDRLGYNVHTTYQDGIRLINPSNLEEWLHSEELRINRKQQRQWEQGMQKAMWIRQQKLELREAKRRSLADFEHESRDVDAGEGTSGVRHI